MTRVLVVEWEEKEGFGAVHACVQAADDIEIVSVREVPETLTEFDAVVLLNLLPEQCRSIERIEVLRTFVNEGGGLFAIHDALFPSVTGGLKPREKTRKKICRKDVYLKPIRRCSEVTC